LDNTENLPIPDDQYMIATPRVEIGEEGRGRSIQKLDPMAVSSKANREVCADVDVHGDA
jgi:hypothetical protein